MLSLSTGLRAPVYSACATIFVILLLFYFCTLLFLHISIFAHFSGGGGGGGVGGVGGQKSLNRTDPLILIYPGQNLMGYFDLIPFQI